MTAAKKAAAKKPKSKQPAAKKARGRPSLYTVAIAEEIISRIEKGEPMASICRDEHMPSTRAVSDWQVERADFGAAIASARARGFDAIAEQALEIADDARNDYMDKLNANGEVVGRQLDAEHVQRSKLRVETRLKLLAKWDPKRYGEKLALGGADDLPPIKSMPDDELTARIAALQAKLNVRDQG